jgi:hypothetical protein
VPKDGRSSGRKFNYTTVMRESEQTIVEKPDASDSDSSEG